MLVPIKGPDISAGGMGIRRFHEHKLAVGVQLCVQWRRYTHVLCFLNQSVLTVKFELHQMEDFTRAVG